MLTRRNKVGFTVVEVLAAIVIVSLILSTFISVTMSASSANARANLRADAGSLAFKKVQDYLNLAYDNIPVGDVVSQYEVEDFSPEAASLKLVNTSAKVYIKPESVVSVPTTVDKNYTQLVSANTAFVSGAEIQSVGYHDTTGYWYAPWRIIDNNYSNYSFSVWAPNPDNLASPSIDLGSSQLVDTIRINWTLCNYGSSNYRIEAKNSSPTSNSGWTTIVSGLSDNGIPCFFGNHPQDIDVSSNTTPYRYWRLYFVDAESSFYDVISELEAFSPGTPGDTVEQYGSDGSSPGALNFSSNTLEMSEDGTNGHQSVGMVFRGVNAANASTINNAYISFVANRLDSGIVTLIVRGADIDNALPWIGNFAVDNAVDTDSSDGSVGTTATVTWVPPAWSAGENGTDTRVDVTAIVQEIINRIGWVGGNDIALTVQYVSGAGKRVAERLPAPQLVIDWTESVTTTPGNYVDLNGDGDADNPTLLRVTSVIEYDSFGERRRVEYTTFIRKFGISD